MENKVTIKQNDDMENDVKFENHDHDLGGTLGATIGGLAAGIGSGVAAGAAIGGIAGPIGVVAGVAIGGAIGGMVGEGVAREINPTEEEKYWEGEFKNRSYVKADNTYDSYRPAYRYGVDAYSEYNGKPYAEVEPRLRDQWNAKRGSSPLDWDDAGNATRDAYDRIYNNRK